MTSTIERRAVELPRRLWTAEEYERAGELGLFGPEERLELIEGEILVKMSPQGSRHAGVIDLVAQALRSVFLSGYVVRVQTPLALGPGNRPEPDLAVVAGNARQYLAGHPTTAVLAVEVSDTTLALDRVVKAGVYATAGIPEYWIVNTVEGKLEVHRTPAPDPDNAGAFRYNSVNDLIPGQTIAPLAAPAHSIPVADLLP
jgi:Uma2 family endonuclease